jgi:hypothetical protein
MHLSIIYSVIYKPRETFEKFLEMPRVEAFIPVLVIAIVNTVRSYPLFRQEESLSSLGLIGAILVGFAYCVIVMLCLPLLATLLVFFLSKKLSWDSKVAFGRLFTALVMCAFPTYLDALLRPIVNLSYLDLGYVLRQMAESHPLAYTALSGVTVSFLWMVLLWWVALGVLLKPTVGVRLGLTFLLVLLEVATSVVLGRGIGEFISVLIGEGGNALP